VRQERLTSNNRLRILDKDCNKFTKYYITKQRCAGSIFFLWATSTNRQITHTNNRKRNIQHCTHKL